MTILVTDAAGGASPGGARQPGVYGHRQIVEQVLQVPLVVGQVGDRALLDPLLRGEHPATAGAPITAMLQFAAYAYMGESVADQSLWQQQGDGGAADRRFRRRLRPAERDLPLFQRRRRRSGR